MTAVLDTDITQIPLYLLVQRVLKQEHLTFHQITQFFSAIKDEKNPLTLRRELLSFVQTSKIQKNRRPLSQLKQKQDMELKNMALHALRSDFHPDVFKTKGAIFAYWLLHDISYPEERKGQCPFFERGLSFYSFACFLERAQKSVEMQHNAKEHNRLMRLIDRKIPRPRER